MRKSGSEHRETMRAAVRADAAGRIVLVGTYRPENADWIAAKRLYNLPLPKCGKLAFHARVGGIVLFAEGARPLAFAARFKEVADRARLAALGYSLAAPSKAHGEAYALYELTAAEKCSSKSRDEAMVLLNNMIDGKRLKDISDLPLDLAC